MDLEKKCATVDNYHILKHIGDGGTSEIRLAYDQKEEKYVALKILKTNNLELVKSEVLFLK